MTEKLYYKDLYRTEFDAEIIRQEIHNGHVCVVLDRSLFYPGGGGQPCDTGMLYNGDNADVADAKEKREGWTVLEAFERDGEILHVLGNVPDDASGPEALPEMKTGGRIHGVIDGGRRFELMQQHLGQHIFSAVLHNQSSLRTARMRIEGDDVSIDLDVHAGEGTIRDAEAGANEVIWQNRPVEILYPDIEEVRRLARKQPPQTSEPVRIVRIDGVDYVPCCGLHVRSTGEVGVLKVTALENHKGGTRVHLRCGRPAFRWLDVLCHAARALQLELTCREADLPERVLNLKEQIRDLKARNDELVNHSLASLAEKLLRDGERIGGRILVSHVLPDAGPDDVKRLFQILTKNHGVVALLAGSGSKAQTNETNATNAAASLVFGCDRDDRQTDVREALKSALAVTGGRGGGSPACAQGRGGDAGKLKEALETAAAVLRASLLRLQ